MSQDNLRMNRVLGIWNVTKHRMTLGGIIVYVSELFLLASVHKCIQVELCLIGDTIPSPLVDSLLPFIKGLTIKRFVSVKHFDAYAKEQPSLVWPDEQYRQSVQYFYDCTLRLRDLYQTYKVHPSLACCDDVKRWVKQFFTKHIRKSVPIAVHLKNNSSCYHCSNANFDEWFKFFSACVSVFPATFILVGNEAIDSRISKLPNVILSRHFKSTLAQDLGIIEQAKIFMGMASGPANMAVSGKHPYVIYKDPDHDVAEMERELGLADHFVFARPMQYLYRVEQDHKRFLKDFKRALNS